MEPDTESAEHRVGFGDPEYLWRSSGLDFGAIVPRLRGGGFSLTGGLLGGRAGANRAGGGEPDGRWRTGRGGG